MQRQRWSSARCACWCVRWWGGTAEPGWKPPWTVWRRGCRGKGWGPSWGKRRCRPEGAEWRSSGSRRSSNGTWARRPPWDDESGWEASTPSKIPRWDQEKWWSASWPSWPLNFRAWGVHAFRWCCRPPLPEVSVGRGSWPGTWLPRRSTRSCRQWKLRRCCSCTSPSAPSD